MTTKFEGIFTALLPPFDKEGRINETALSMLIEDNLKKGLSGFYVNESAFNLISDKFIRIHELFKAGDIKEAMKVQEAANVIIAAFAMRSYNPSLPLS